MKKIIQTSIAVLSLCSFANAFVIDFEDADLPADSFDSGPTENGETVETDNPFGSNGVLFTTTGTFDFLGEIAFSNVFNLYENPPGTESTTYWNGFALSNVVDTTTEGFANQYASFPGGGTDLGGGTIPGGTYASVFNPSMGSATITLPEGVRAPQVLMLTNTTYAALSMQNGDSIAKKFEQGDWFQLSIIGFDASGNEIGEVNVFLADFRSSNPEDHYILDRWEPIDLRPLGHFGNEPVAEIQFQLYSSDNGDFGMNTPAYFAMDALHVAPTAFTGAQVSAYNFSVSDWFGRYYDMEFPWIYHEGLGWFYLDAASSSSIGELTFHHVDLGWLNTKSSIFPWVYQFSSGTWLYYFKGTSNPMLFYNDSTGEIVEIGG